MREDWPAQPGMTVPPTRRRIQGEKGAGGQVALPVHTVGILLDGCVPVGHEWFPPVSTEQKTLRSGRLIPVLGLCTQ